MTDRLPVDPDALRDEVRDKYRAVALHPDAAFHFHTGRALAARLGYEPAVVDALPAYEVYGYSVPRPQAG